MAIGKLYGTAPADVIVRVNADTGDPTADFGPWPDGTTFTAWTAFTGGTQITELYDAGQTPVAVVTGKAPLYRTIFYGPASFPGSIYLQDPAGNRYRMDPSDLASRTGGGGIDGISVNGTAVPGAVPDVAINSQTISDATTIGKKVLTATSTDAARAAIGLSSAQLNAIIDARIAANGGGGGGGSTAAVYDSAVYDSSTYQ